MKKLILGLLLLVCFYGWGQQRNKYKNGLEFTTKRKIADTLFGLLNPKIYGPSLIDRSMATDNLLIKELKGDYNVISSGKTWLQAYSDIGISYLDSNYMYSNTLLINKLKDFYDSIIDIKPSDRKKIKFGKHVAYISHESDELKQPFGLLLHQTSKIDTNLYDRNKKKNAFINQNNQLKLKSNYKEQSIYHSILLKSAALIQTGTVKGYSEETIVYDPNFISISPNVKISSIQLDLGNGFHYFGKRNTTLKYKITKSWQIGKAAITYFVNNIRYRDTLSFYLTNKISQSHERSVHRFDDTYTIQFDNKKPKLRVGIRYGFGNDGKVPFGPKFPKVKRPVIIAPPYRPFLQFWVNLNFFWWDYWDQFNYKSVMSYLSDMGYDVIFIKEKPGNKSIKDGGDVLALFIQYINNEKHLNFPNQSWENIVMGYSAGGQQMRYALKKMEKEHMEGNGPAHHCRLFIPFDSPNWGANVPMFAQALFYDFNYSWNVLAALVYEALKDDASRAMLLYHIAGSSIDVNNHDRIIHPTSDVIRQNLMYALNNSFNHQYTPMNDLRKSFPTFTWNVAVSTGDNAKNYTSDFGLTPGMKLFSQSAFIPSIFGPKIIDRKIFASKYASNALVFERKDKMLAGGFIPVWRTRYYKIKWAYEWDMAQGGYKDIFYDGAFGATGILRSSVLFSGFTPGQKYYNSHVSFMPMVSSLAINPNIWKNNNILYNLKSNGLMFNKFDISTHPPSNFFGYPHLGHPNNHFSITPFEAIYCDPVTSEHIKMQKSAGNNQTKNEDLVHLRDFILNEVEAKTVYFQNKDMGINHALNDNNFKYTAWYKAENEIIVGKLVTPKTDPGPYLIENTADITMYACNAIDLKPGFHAKAGSQFHAFIRCDRCNGPVRPLYPPENKSLTPSNTINPNAAGRKDKSNAKKDSVKVYPNPSNGKITVVFSKDNGKYQIANIEGQVVKKGDVNSKKYSLYLSKGIYILKWISKNEIQTKKIIIL